MVNDIVLSGLINLFALFGATADVDSERSKELLSTYLKRHFGIRQVDEYIGLYDDFKDLYLLSPELDKDAIIGGICSSLRSNMLKEDQLLILLRLMEFCLLDGIIDEEENEIINQAATHLQIKKAFLKDFFAYITGKTTKRVLVQKFPGWSGEIKTLFLESENILVFTYMGEDEVLMNDIPVLPGIFQIWQQSGVLKSHYGAPLYYSSMMASYMQGRQNQSVTFQGRGIEFRFPNSDNGMHSLDFDMHSGELLAIMGGSGTGKTTLLSLLNGSLRPQSGSITINGHDISDPEARSLIGFVPQDDLLVEELTVYQNLYYTARFCFQGLTDEQLDKKITMVLKDLDLLHARNLIVGNALNKFISGGQRKRLNIALELIREPAVLFLDEPTSGLSSADTERVILLLKEQTQRGRLVVCNIHQPSSDVYKLFDRLWLLDKGGYPIYDGNPIDALTYFKKAANYADASVSMCPVCGNVNPEVVLNIIDEKALTKSGKLSDQRKVTPQEWHQMYKDMRGTMSEIEETPIPDTDQKRPSAIKQLWIYLQRNVETKLKNRQYLAITFLEAPLLALICGALTHYSPESGYTLLDNKNLVSFLFMAIIVATFVGMSGSAEEIIRDKALLKREKFLRLSYSSYLWSKIIYSAVISLIQTGLFILVGGFIMGLSTTLPTWWGILFTTAFLANLTGLLLSQWMNSVVSIYISIPLLLIPQILLCGLVVSFSDLTPRSTTGNVPIVGDFIPSRWSFEALAVEQYRSNRYEAPIFEAQKERFRLQYEQWGVIYQLKSEVETRRDEMQRGKDVNPSHLLLIRNELPRLTALCGIEPYQGDSTYASLKGYLGRLEDVIKDRSNQWTLLEDRINRDRMAAMSEELAEGETLKDRFRQLKRNNHNTYLQTLVAGSDNESLCRVIDGNIVPQAGIIYLLPRSTNGRAPFYSSVKRIGTLEIPTLIYNLSMLLLMSLGCLVLLFLNLPERLHLHKS